MRGKSADPAQRRRFLAAATGCAALGLLPAAALRAAGAGGVDRPWIPSDAFLAGLPEWMRAFGVPGVAIDRETLAEAGLAWGFTTSAIGVGIGVVGFAVVQWRRRAQSVRAAEDAAVAALDDETPEGSA